MSKSGNKGKYWCVPDNCFIHTVYHPNRHCSCVFKDIKNVDRLNSLIQGLLLTSSNLLKCISRSFDATPEKDKPEGVSPQKRRLKVKPKEDKVIVDENVDSRDGSDEDEEDEEEEMDREVEEFEEDVAKWTLDEKEKLFHMVSKAMYVHFPLYAIHKHSLHQTRLEDLTPKEAGLLSSYCDLSDPEMPLLLLRNITFYCEQDVMDLFVSIFSKATPTVLPLSLAHAIIAVIHHLKYGLNVNSLLPKLVSLRTYVITYLCKVRFSFVKLEALADNLCL